MQRKRDLTTIQVKSTKARLNLHGGNQVYRMNYFETFAHVVIWFAIRLMLSFGIIFGLALRQVDFVVAYPQALNEMDIYMELSQRNPECSWELQESYVKVREKHLRTEASRSRMELTPRRQAHVHRIYTFPNR